MFHKKKTASIEKPQTIPNSLAASIPYENVYPNGIFELREGLFSKSYSLPDMNFKIVDDNKQLQIVEKYSQFLNSFDHNTAVEITLYNKTIDINQFQEKVFVKMNSDSLNPYRMEYNEMLMGKMAGAKNNIETIKILSIAIFAKDIIEATDKFIQIDEHVKDGITDITSSPAEAMSTLERLDLLNSIYNQDSTVPLYRKRNIQGHVSESFTLENCAEQGITTKDVIAPPGLKFSNYNAEIGENYSKTYYVSNYPTWIRGTIFTDFAALPMNALISVYFKTIESNEAIKFVRRQGTNISSSLVDTQKRASKSGYDPSLISPDVQDAKKEVNELLDGMTKNNERLFVANFLVTIFAPTEEVLKTYEEQLKTIANNNLITLKPVGMQQERAFNSSLPLAHNQLSIERLMSSNTVGAIIPFDMKELRQTSGIYYGLNAVTKNMIFYDRTEDLNPCACILGMPGSGKSFSSKREIIDILLNTDDEVYVIDPEREYTVLAKEFNGSVVKIANGGINHINPFDMNMNNVDDDGDPVKVKSDFIQTLCDIAIGGKYGLGPREQSIIDRCVRNIYEPYISHLRKTGQDIDYDNAITMKNFYNELLMQPQPEAQDLALSLERYAIGGSDIFAHKTNMDVNNRFTVYDIKDIGAGLEGMGIHICLDHIWNKMIENFALGKRTWIYIDEFYLLMKKQSSATYVSKIWKRARKWNGIPTAMTQNVEDMLKSEEARTIINNSSFVMLLRQAPMNKVQLCNLLNISSEEEKYISTIKPGMGLICIGDNIIPMDDNFPKDTRLYKIMTTKPTERIMDA